MAQTQSNQNSSSYLQYGDGFWQYYTILICTNSIFLRKFMEKLMQGQRYTFSDLSVNLLLH